MCLDIDLHFHYLKHWSTSLFLSVYVLWEFLNDSEGLCVWAPHLTCPKQSHVRCPAKKPSVILPEQLESKLPANGTTACTCQFTLAKQRNHTNTHTQACGFTHTFSNLFVEKEEKNERECQRNETRIMCVLTETLTIFLKVMKHFLSVRMRFSIWNLSSFFVLSIHLGFWQSGGREEEVERDGSPKGYVANCRVIGWTKSRSLLWLVEQGT